MDTLRSMTSPTMAGVCSVVSVAGIIILGALGLAYENNAEVVMGTTEDPEDGHAVAIQLWSAAAVYAGFLVLSGLRLGVHARYSKRGDIRL